MKITLETNDNNVYIFEYEETPNIKDMVDELKKLLYCIIRNEQSSLQIERIIITCAVDRLSR